MGDVNCELFGKAATKERKTRLIVFTFHFIARPNNPRGKPKNILRVWITRMGNFKTFRKRKSACYAISSLHNSFSRFIRFSVLVYWTQCEIPFRDRVGTFRQYFNSHTKVFWREGLKNLNQLIFYCASQHTHNAREQFLNHLNSR